MTLLLPVLTLWTYSLAALLFGALAFSRLRGDASGAAATMLIVALGATALWALAIAGIGATDVAARIAECLRNLMLLALAATCWTRARREMPGATLSLVYIVAAVLALGSVGLAVMQSGAVVPNVRQALIDGRQAVSMLVAVTALVLVHDLHAVGRDVDGGATTRSVVAVLAILWTSDFVYYALVYATEGWGPAVVLLRGWAAIVAAAAFAIASGKRGDHALLVSRGITLRLLAGLALAAFAAIVVAATSIAAVVGGSQVRLIQTGIVFGATASLMTLVSTPWLRAWTRVTIEKHLFRMRYDYRTEWQRFTDTLGRPGDGAAPLETRIVKAIADLTDSPAGLLLIANADGLEAGEGWAWDGDARPPQAGDPALARYLGDTGRIIELDLLRKTETASDEAAVVPDWMLADAQGWVIVPLLHVGVLVGAILLARPPVRRMLDWEDLDLLRLAGRQAASYLAEDRAHAALADAQRFDEFNRRFAFILHDIKNLVSQLSLVARNAERHADNPDFRADMVATLKDSSDRMNALLARLSQHGGARTETVQPVDVVRLMDHVAAGRRAAHPIVTEAADLPMALADPVRLEQAMGHLVQNAVEASGAGDPVVLRATQAEDRLAIDVIDHGCGMAPAFVRDRLFRPFASSTPSGFGIGAYEARPVLQAMAGSMTVTSREGEGTRFRILLPLAGSMEQAA